jgi:hypothetical protein
MTEPTLIGWAYGFRQRGIVADDLRAALPDNADIILIDVSPVLPAFRRMAPTVEEMARTFRAFGLAYPAPPIPPLPWSRARMARRHRSRR